MLVPRSPTRLGADRRGLHGRPAGRPSPAQSVSSTARIPALRLRHGPQVRRQPPDRLQHARAPCGTRPTSSRAGSGSGSAPWRSCPIPRERSASTTRTPGWPSPGVITVPRTTSPAPWPRSLRWGSSAVGASVSARSGAPHRPSSARPTAFPATATGPARPSAVSASRPQPPTSSAAQSTRRRAAPIRCT
jgi:hypothetical protein